MHLSSLETLNAHQWATAPWRDWSCQLAGRPLGARLIIAAMSVVMMSVGMGCLAWLSWLDLMAVSWWEWFACVAMAGAGLGLWSYEQKRDETSWKALLEQLEKLPAALRQTLAHSPEVPPLVREGLLKGLPRMENQGACVALERSHRPGVGAAPPRCTDHVARRALGAVLRGALGGR